MFLEIRKWVALSLFALAAVPGLTRELKALREGSANKGSGFGVQELRPRGLGQFSRQVVCRRP